MGANTSRANLELGANAPLTNLELSVKKKHNPILGYDFRVMAFKWKIFLENHDLSVIICDFYLFINTYNFQFIWLYIYIYNFFIFI